MTDGMARLSAGRGPRLVRGEGRPAGEDQPDVGVYDGFGIVAGGVEPLVYPACHADDGLRAVRWVDSGNDAGFGRAPDDADEAREVLTLKLVHLTG